MEKIKIFKSVCMILALAVCTAFLPSYAMAEEIASDSKTITVEYDTYIDKNQNTTSYAESTILKFQRNGNYHRESFLGFNLDEIAPEEGMEIVSAKITVYLESYYYKINNKNTKNASVLSLYTMGNLDYIGDSVNIPEITWKSSYNSGKKKIAATTFCPNNVFTDKEAYDFDITEYIKSKKSVSGRETFAIFPNTQYVSGALYSKERESGKYAATMTVTYKYSDKNLSVTDTAFASQDSTSDNSLNEYSMQNIGSSKHNRAMYSKFDLSSLTIPEGAAISKATLRLYATKNYNECPTDVRVYNIEDDSWTDETVVSDEVNSSWENAPGSAHILSGLGTTQGISSVATVPYEGSSTINQWIECDVTSYVSNQYYTDENKMASFAVYPESYITSGAVYIASDNYEGFEPELVIGFAKEEEVSVGTPVFSGNVLSENIDSLVNGKRVFVKIPVFGASSTPLNTNIYVVQYDAENDALVSVDVYRDVDFYAGNCEFSFGLFTKYYNKPCYANVYVWSPDGLSYADAHIDMTAP